MKTQHLLLFISLFFLAACGEDDEFQAQHNQGKNCLECHGFTSGATLYKKIDGADYAVDDVARGYSLQLRLESGTILTYTKGNGYGNKLYNGDQGAINNFTPQVVDANGKIVNQSSQNSHHVGRLACNRCHTQNGLNGAPGRIVNYDYFGNLAVQTKQQ
ncbi:MAG TPA: hypothetical protein ENK39_00510 [Epsilonproteobacteria bacterium]|nr:hypothetical protein [Campylobacterota bacterium]